MSNVSYKPLIEDMTWSYSRIKTYEDCSYKFFLKYIKEFNDEPMFYASYGKFMHKLIEQFYRGELTKEQMLATFLTDFKSEVKGVRPNDTSVSKYINAGCQYLRKFQSFPFNTIDIEKEVFFDVGDYKFTGFIDFIGEHDGKLYIVDHKSRELSPRSGRITPTAKDRLLDDMLKQLYLYSVAIEQEFGCLPEALCFNCFKNGVFIKEPFDKQKYEETKQWAVDKIRQIENTESFDPNRNYFSCRWICGLHNHCPYDIEAREEARKHR